MSRIWCVQDLVCSRANVSKSWCVQEHRRVQELMCLGGRCVQELCIQELGIQELVCPGAVYPGASVSKR